MLLQLLPSDWSDGNSPGARRGREDQVLEFKKVIDKVTPAKFEEYYGYYKSIREKENRSWASIRKPFVMTSSVTASGN